jgi:5-methyltetrahydrofolate--homocysteine methyltransferase
MQLPFVLRSAECMKAAVAWLEPHMEKAEGQNKGTMVLATVKGDVHDIGKNLVDIILTNNGYKVVNLGIKQPLTDILTATREHKADAIGMSGLLVKSTVIMKDNLEEMARQGLSVPVVLGGAALTRGYVEGECVAAYTTGPVAYARDAFDGLGLMDKVMKGEFAAYCAARTAQHNSRPKNDRRKLGEAVNSVALSPDEAKTRRLGLRVEVPTPPFWGARLSERVEPKALLPYLNERILYQLQWGYRKDGKSLDEYLVWAQRELKPILLNLLERCEREDILRPQVVYGFYEAVGQGEDLVLYHEGQEAARFTLPRAPDGQSITDYVRDEAEGRDVVALQVVTMGQRCADVAREWFAANDYQNYLYLHGISVELTEALAEYTHKRIRAELGLAGEDARDLEGLLQQKYRGSRYSFGYPACPALEDQIPILNLLGAERIGVNISDEFQLHPEQSTSALVIHHPKAKYFSV